MNDLEVGGYGGRRGEALQSCRTPDIRPELAFDRIVDLARTLFGVPIATVTVFDDDRHVFKGRTGLNAFEAPCACPFLEHAHLVDEIMVVPNARTDPRFSDNPLVIGAPHVCFYAGVPVVAHDGARLGTVSIMSPDARSDLSHSDCHRLEMLAGIALDELELRRHAANADRLTLEKAALAADAERRVQSSLHLVTGMLEAQAIRSEDPSVRQALSEAIDRISGGDSMHAPQGEDGAFAPGDIEAYLLGLIATLQQSMGGGARRRTISVDVGDELFLTQERLAPLGMVTTELVTNALDHGRGAVDVRLQADDGELVVSVTDEGAGLKLGRSPIIWSKSLGLRLVARLALPGGVNVDPARPQRVVVRLPN